MKLKRNIRLCFCHSVPLNDVYLVFGYLCFAYLQQPFSDVPLCSERFPITEYLAHWIIGESSWTIDLLGIQIGKLESQEVELRRKSLGMMGRIRVFWFKMFLSFHCSDSLYIYIYIFFAIWVMLLFCFCYLLHRIFWLLFLNALLCYVRFRSCISMFSSFFVCLFYQILYLFLHVYCDCCLFDIMLCCMLRGGGFYIFCLFVSFCFFWEKVCWLQLIWWTCYLYNCHWNLGFMLSTRYLFCIYLLREVQFLNTMI